MRQGACADGRPEDCSVRDVSLPCRSDRSDGTDEPSGRGSRAAPIVLHRRNGQKHEQANPKPSYAH